MHYTLTSLHNPTIKNLVKLRQRRERDRQQLLLIDGARALALALRNAFPLLTIYVAEAALTAHAALLQHARDAALAQRVVSAAVFSKIGYGDHPDGILAVATQPNVALSSLPQPETVPLYLIAEGLEKPGNLGAILRSADAAGVTAVLVCDSRTDIWNPNVIRASQGAFCTVPIAATTAAESQRWLQQQGVQIIAATPTARIRYTEINFCGPSALVLGAEHAGLSRAWHQASQVGIPMAGQVDSLNVAQAASIILFEALRQRLCASQTVP